MTPKCIVFACLLLSPSLAFGQEAPSLGIVWPPAGAEIPLGDDPEGRIGVVVTSNFKLMPAGGCGEDTHCGHVHMRIDPQGDSCNIPEKNYNSMNSDFGGSLIAARFGHCETPKGEHVIGILLADDNHQPVLVDGQPVTALVPVTTR